MAQRIAIVGARGFATQTDDYLVDCIPWDRLSKLPNLSDYDTLILNLIPLDDDAKRGRVDWTAFSRRLHPGSANDILSHGGRVIVLGDPRFSIQRRGDDGQQVDEPFLHWSGLTFRWVEESGRSNRATMEDYRDRNAYGPYLLNSVGIEWSYYLADCETNDEVQSRLLNLEYMKEKNVWHHSTLTSFRKHRYGGHLAFKVHLAFYQRQRQSYGEDYSEEFAQNGPIVFLPRTSLDDEESVAVILRDACGVEVSLPEPEWIGLTVAPGQGPLDQAITDLWAKIESQADEYRQLKAERHQKRQVLRLLYDRGTSLEDIVRATLRDLGGDVEDPTDPGQEDGWVTVQVDGQAKEAVLEVKGTAKDVFNEDGLNQLYKWKLRGIEFRQKAYKGIFVGNSADERPPDERPDPFGHNFRTHAELQEAAVILTTDLYVVYRLKDAGLLNVEDFWRVLFATRGVFDGAKYRAMLPAEPGASGT